MILRMLALASAAVFAAGCAGNAQPDADISSWSAQRLSGGDPAGGAARAPGFVPERVLDAGTLASMAASERALLRRGAQIRDAADSVSDPEESAEDYAVRQRARQTP